MPEELAQLRRARDLMDRDYARPLDMPAMARAALMSPAHFSRQFRAAYGETPYNSLMTRRIERAMALLRRGDLSAYRARDHRAGAAVPACVARVWSRPRRGGPGAGTSTPSRNGEAGTRPWS